MATPLDRFASNHFCPDCGKGRLLTVRWNGQAEQVWCRFCGRTGGFERRKDKSYKQQWMDDPESVTVAIANKMALKYGDDIRQVAEGLPEELGQAIIKRYLPRTE